MSSSQQRRKEKHGQARRRTILHQEAFVTPTQERGSRSVPPNSSHVQQTSTSERRSQFVERAIAKFKEAENTGSAVLEYIRVSSFPDDEESFTDAEAVQESSLSTTYGCSNIGDDSDVDQFSSYGSGEEEETGLWRSHLRDTTLSDSLETALSPSLSMASNYGSGQSTSPYFWSDNSFDYLVSLVTAVDRNASSTTTRSHLRIPSVETAQKGVSPSSLSTSGLYTSSSGSGLTIMSPSFSSNYSSTFSGSSSNVSNDDDYLLLKPLGAQTQLYSSPVEMAKSPSIKILPKIPKQQKLSTKISKQQKHPVKVSKQNKRSMSSNVSSLSSSAKHSSRKALTPSRSLKTVKMMHNRRPSSAMTTACSPSTVSERSSINFIATSVKRFSLQKKQNIQALTGRSKSQQQLDSPSTVLLDSRSLHTVHLPPFSCNSNTAVRTRDSKDSGASTNGSRNLFSVPSSNQEFSLTDISSVTADNYRTPPTSIGNGNERMASGGSSNGFRTVPSVLRRSTISPLKNVTCRPACDNIRNQVARVEIRNVSSLVSDIPSDAPPSQKSAVQGRRASTISSASSTESIRHQNQQSNVTPTFRHSRDLQLRMLVNESDEPLEANVMFNFKSVNDTPKVELAGVSLDDKPVWRSGERQPCRGRTSQQSRERPI